MTLTPHERTASDALVPASTPPPSPHLADRDTGQRAEGHVTRPAGRGSRQRAGGPTEHHRGRALRSAAVALAVVGLASACWRLDSTVREVRSTSVGLPVTICDSPSPLDDALQQGTLLWSWGDTGGAGNTSAVVYSDAPLNHCRSHTFAAPGQYEGTLTVSPGDAGQAAREIGVSVVEQDEPLVVATNTCTCHLRADLSASLLESETIADQTWYPDVREQFHWTFGDGTSATTATAQTSHTYAAAGTYTVSVTEVVPYYRAANLRDFGEVRSWSATTVRVGA